MIFESENYKDIFEKYSKMDFEKVVKFSNVVDKYKEQSIFTYKNEVKTGFSLLDESLRGIKPGEVVYILSKTNIGKTTLAMNMIKHNLTEDSIIQFFSLENNEYQMFERMVQIELELPVWEIEKRFANNDTKFIEECREVSKKWDCVANVIKRIEIKELTPYIQTIEEVMQKKSKMIVLDYLQLIKSREQSEYARMSEISQNLKEMSLNLNLPIIVLSQVSRQEARAEQGLNIHSAKGSGEIENSGQIILALEKCAIHAKNEEKEIFPQILLQYYADWSKNEGSYDFLKITTLKKKRGVYKDVFLRLDYPELKLTQIDTNIYKPITF